MILSLIFSCASVSGSEVFYDDTSMDFDADGKRKNRNLSEKKRRDQFNILINELGSMVECEASSLCPSSSSRDNKQINSQQQQQQPSQSHFGFVSSSSCSSSSNLTTDTHHFGKQTKQSVSQTNANKKLDKSTILRATIDFLKEISRAKKAEAKKEAQGKGSQSTQEESLGKDIDEDVMLAWKPSYLSHNEFAHLMMEVRNLSHS